MAWPHKEVAKGVAKSACGKRTVVCKFDVLMFEQVRKRAIREKTSFAEQIRLLVEWGLEAESAP